MQKNCNFNLAEIKQKVANNAFIQSNIRIKVHPEENPQDSAVLVPIVMHQDQVSLLFTHRSNSLERHSGQVSFPGGIIEENDGTVIETALRETREEIGISSENIQIIGQLIPFNTSTGYIVYPVIGVIDTLEKLSRNILEVDRIFCIPLNWLCNANHSKLEKFVVSDGKAKDVWYFDLYDGELLWGITAKITKEFIEIIKK